MQEFCTGIAWHLAFPAAGIAWLNFLESPPSPPLHASSPPDEQDARHKIFLLLCSEANVSPAADFTSSKENTAMSVTAGHGVKSRCLEFLHDLI